MGDVVGGNDITMEDAIDEDDLVDATVGLGDLDLAGATVALSDLGLEDTMVDAGDLVGNNTVPANEMAQTLQDFGKETVSDMVIEYYSTNSTIKYTC